MRTILKILIMLFGVVSYTQTTVNGTITDQSDQPLSGATVIVVGTSTGVVADFDGNYEITIEQDSPFTIEASSVGFIPSSIEVSGSSTINFVLEDNTALDEVVVSASRTPQRVFESPVTIERFDTNDIKKSASADFYDGLENLKGVDINVNSFTFKAVNTRGFATFANTRFVQLVDGMDNSAPALNFPLGNLLGMTETDVLNVEIIPGTSSSLYGANAFNGILLMNSKNPFDYQGISGQYKRGITSSNASGDNEYQDLQIRWGHKFSSKLAMKFNFAYMRGKDWVANSEVDALGRLDENGIGLTRAAYNHDGINIYGDEVAADINGVAQLLESMGLAPSGISSLVPSVTVSRTGYNEVDLTDHIAESKKADWGLYYRPIENSNFELSYVGKWGSGQTLYQATNRLSIEDFIMTQHKIEVKNDNYFARAYVVADDAVDTYDMAFTAININRAWSDDNTWFGTYVNGYASATLAGATDAQAHAQGRLAADAGRYLPGTPEFVQAFESVKSISDGFLTGSKFADKSKFYHLDYNYNFGHLWDWAEVQLGGSARRYSLNSGGVIFTDYDDNIEYQEIGVYTQIVKDFLDDRLKVTASARVDKSELFDAELSPRISLAYTAGELRNHNFRVSYQTGFRNPTTQGLFIGLDLQRARLIGSAPDNPSRYVRDYNVSVAGQALGIPAVVTLTGETAFTNSFSLASVGMFAATQDPSMLQASGIQKVKPEQIESFEFGYRGKLTRSLTIDASVYRNDYADFINTQQVISPYYGEVGDNSLSVLAVANNDFEVWSAYTNAQTDISSWGASIGVATKIFGNFDLSGSYTKSVLDFDRDAYPDFDTNWNTPDDKFKAQFGNTSLFRNFGFNVAWRWHDDFYWEATFGEGPVPAAHVVDFQVNLTVPKWKSVLKMGATNIGGDEYFTAFGSGFIGQQYYISLTANNF